MNSNRTRGFSLIELMLVVAVVAILGSIAVNSYRNNVIASNRTEGRAALAQTAASLEKCRALYGRYDNNNCNVTLPFFTESNYYRIESTAMTGSTFTLTATPLNSQIGDADCTLMSLTNTGIKGGNGGKCW